MPSVAVIVAELHIPGTRSLKEKRSVVKGAVDRLHQRLRVSVAETGLLDKHQRSELTIAVVLTSFSSRSEELRRLLETDPGLVITAWDAEIIDLM